MPYLVHDMPLDEFFIAHQAAVEYEREHYRHAAYSVFLQHAKKGTTWSSFLDELGLGYGKKKTRRGRGSSREELDRLYKLAEQIRKSDLGDNHV